MAMIFTVIRLRTESGMRNARTGDTHRFYSGDTICIFMDLSRDLKGVVCVWGGWVRERAPKISASPPTTPIGSKGRPLLDHRGVVRGRCAHAPSGVKPTYTRVPTPQLIQYRNTGILF